MEEQEMVTPVADEPEAVVEAAPVEAPVEVVAPVEEAPVA